LAIHLARKHNIEVLGLTIADGNAPLDQEVKNAQLLLKILKRDDIPVYKGNNRET